MSGLRRNVLLVVAHSTQGVAILLLPNDATDVPYAWQVSPAPLAG